MIIEGVAKEVVKGALERIEKEVEELPEEIGELSEVELLPDEIGEELEPNSSFEINGIIYETDDNSQIFKVDGELIPNIEYVCNGIKYNTDYSGKIISWDGNPFYNPEGERDTSAQTDVGGQNRKPGDDGGHLVARITGGSTGNENLVPMRDTINRGDYKKAENEIVSALKNGSEVIEKGTVIYEGENSRPIKIMMEYSYDDINKILIVDNVEGSIDLVKEIKDIILEEDYKNLVDEIDYMIDDGCEVSITSVLKELDSEDNIKRITVGIRDETESEKYYKTFDVLKES